MRVERELMRGAGPVAVLQLLGRREMYGYELVEALSKRSDGVLAMGHSTLYPLLYSLEAKGLVESEERAADSGRIRRYYKVTTAGRKWLNGQRQQWQALGRAMAGLGILDALPGRGKR
jgi:PadR family transcriptional regulator PadR